MRRFVQLAAAAALTASLAIVPVAYAKAPTIETEAVGPETFFDEFLSEACGVDVYTTIVGRRTQRTFDRVTGVQVVNTVNLSLTARSGDNWFRFRDVGADVVQNAGGTLTLLIIGQVPFDFRGVLKIDLATGDVIHEPHFVDADRACAALTS